MSQPRVKVKVYGLLWLSRRAYLTIQTIGLLLVVLAIGIGLLFPRPVPVGDAPLPPFVRLLSIALDVLPFFALLVLVVEAIETWIVLGKFERAEAQQRAAAALTEATSPGNPHSPGTAVPETVSTPDPLPPATNDVVLP